MTYRELYNLLSEAIKANGDEVILDNNVTIFDTQRSEVFPALYLERINPDHSIADVLDEGNFIIAF